MLFAICWSRSFTGLARQSARQPARPPASSSVRPFARPPATSHARPAGSPVDRQSTRPTPPDWPPALFVRPFAHPFARRAASPSAHQFDHPPTRPLALTSVRPSAGPTARPSTHRCGIRRSIELVDHLADSSRLSALLTIAARCSSQYVKHGCVTPVRR